MLTTKQKLFGIENFRSLPTRNKVSIIGIGQVGMACAFSMLNHGIVNEIALNDIEPNKLKGEAMDLREGMAFAKTIKIIADTDLKVTSDSSVIIITAGCRQRPGESRLDLVQRNTEIYKKMIPKLASYSPEAVLLVVSNPVDIMTYVTWKLSGFPASRVIGSGTNLDSARFRFYIGEKLGISPTSCHGWIIGEHGDSSVAVWSGVNVGGVSLMDLNPKLGQDDDPEEWNLIHKQIINSAYEIIQCKGYTNWAIGLSVTEIVRSILKNENRVYALSTNLNDWTESSVLGIGKDIFLSVPCVIGQNGVQCKVTQSLNKPEGEKLVSVAKKLQEIQNNIKF